MPLGRVVIFTPRIMGRTKIPYSKFMTELSNKRHNKVIVIPCNKDIINIYKKIDYDITNTINKQGRINFATVKPKLK